MHRAAWQAYTAAVVCNYECTAPRFAVQQGAHTAMHLITEVSLCCCFTSLLRHCYVTAATVECAKAPTEVC
eukprot:792-Heterococcus_DN1.PRE.3